LKGIVDDVGADRGYLVSKLGVQRGARAFLNHPINVEGLTIDQFRAMVERPRVMRFGPRKMSIATCTGCGAHVEVPFPPKPGARIYCHTCSSFVPTLLASHVDFGLLGDRLGDDVQSGLKAALAKGAVFQASADALAIFRHVIATAIGRIHEDGRAPLFLRFLKDGPYECAGEIPLALRDKRLTDAETATVITFVYSHMVNCFKGALTELLAVKPCLQLLRDLKAENSVQQEANLYVGDSVLEADRVRPRN